MDSDFLSSLAHTDDAAWARIVGALQSAIHPVDRNATRLWFAFYPVKLARAFAAAADQAALAKKLIIKGNPSLPAQADSSAEFLYGHRFWPQVKAAVSDYAAHADASQPLDQHVQTVAQLVAAQVKAEVALVLGITAVAFGTLQQIGAEAFKQPAAAGDYGKHWNKSADQIVADRAKDDSQGVFGFLKSVDKTFTVNFRECEPGHSFKVTNMQDVAMAAKEDGKPYHIRDERYKAGEGPIPVECRTAACGTCWVGVLSPTEKISPPTDREIAKWKYFGYEGFTGTADSPIRLACQLKAYGNVTITIPSWCGMIGKLDEPQEEAKAAKA
jgi:ferredoxin